MGSDIHSCTVKWDYDNLGFKLKINEDNMDHMEKLGIFKVSDILKSKKKLEGFNKSLIQAIHWFANSQKQSEKENEFLSLMICLEIFLTEKNSPITKSIAEGATIILTTELENSNIEDVIDYRIKLREKITDLYSKRGNIVHGRWKNIDDEDLNCLRSISFTLIRYMIDHNDDFKDKTSLLKWIEEQKFKGF